MPSLRWAARRPGDYCLAGGGAADERPVTHFCSPPQGTTDPRAGRACAQTSGVSVRLFPPRALLLACLSAREAWATVEVGDPPAGCHSGSLLSLGGCPGRGHPAGVPPAWGQPCSVLAEEEGPARPGPSVDRLMTTSEDPSPAQPGGTSELRWVPRVGVHGAAPVGREAKVRVVGGLFAFLQMSQDPGDFDLELQKAPISTLRRRTGLLRKHPGPGCLSSSFGVIRVGNAGRWGSSIRYPKSKMQFFRDSAQRTEAFVTLGMERNGDWVFKMPLRYPRGSLLLGAPRCIGLSLSSFSTRSLPCTLIIGNHTPQAWPQNVP